jgi:hypothetical protein
MPTKIYRFKFSKELNEKIIEFSEMHRYDDKERLKENFDNWCHDNADHIKQEWDILKDHDYKTECDIQSKIFKSIKYYHIKKLNKQAQAQQPNDNQAQNNKYKRKNETNISLSCEVLREIQDFIQRNGENDNFKPSIYYDQFVKENCEFLQREKASILNKHADVLDEDMVDFKIKKIFKNQHYLYVKNK